MSSRRSATPASKEYALETALNTMPAAWEGVKLELMDYRDTGTYIMQGSEKMTQLMEDQITMTQAIYRLLPFQGRPRGGHRRVGQEARRGLRGH